MNYSEIALVLKCGFLIDLDNKSILEREELKNNNYEKLVDVILWETVWQCNEYFIPEDFFGTEHHPGENLEKIQLVMSIEKNFNYIIRRIIIENVAMDTFLSLGKKFYSTKRIIDGMKYIAMFSDEGYYEMIATNKLDECGKIKKEEVEKRKEELYGGDPMGIEEKYNEEIKKYDGKYNKVFGIFKKSENSKDSKNNYITSYAKQSTFFKEYSDYLKNRKPKQTIQIPAFECKQFATMLREKNLNLINNVLTEMDEDKKFSEIKKHRTLIQKLEFSKQKTQQSIQKENLSKIEKMKNLDDNIHNYYLEKYLHGKLQDEVIDICRELSNNYDLKLSSLQNSLIDTINMNLQFGMNYVLRYPIKYIYNPHIKFDNKSSSNTKNFNLSKNEAEKIWIDKYCEYLATLSYVTIPLVRTAFEINLYDCCKVIVQKESDTKESEEEKLIEKKMLELLELYERENSKCVNFDFDSENIEVSLASKTDFTKMDDYITTAISLKEMAKFNNDDKIALEDLEKEKEGKLVLQFYPIWFEPKNFEQFYNKVIDENYYKIGNDKAMDYYKKKIIEVRQKSIIAKYNKKWKR